MFAEPSADPSQALFRRIVDVSIQLNSTHDTDQLLTYIIEAAADLLDCEAASLLLFDEASQQLHFVASTGSDPEKLAQIPVPLKGSIAGRIYSEGITIIEQDVSKAADHFKAVGEKVAFETRSLLGVPLSIEGERLGVLEALNKRGGWFSAEDEAVMRALSVQAALALRNARQMEAVREAYEKLEAFEEFRSAFMAIASHELRTPLAIVSQILDLIKGEVSEDLKSFAHDAYGAAERMRDVLDTMAQLELLRSHATSERHVSVDVQRALRAVIRDVTPAIANKRHVLTLETGDEPVYVSSDRDRVFRVLMNLLKNAIAFTPENGSITVRMKEKRGGILVEVEDNGMGLEQDQLERVFEEYYQVEHYLTRSQDGLGLGLTIARRLVEMDKGQIWITSQGLGKGIKASVWYRQPLERETG